MVSPQLLEILVCPDTKQPVKPAGEELVKKLNRKIDEGSLKNKAGEAVQEKMDAGLVREDGKMLYRVVEDIPIMLIDEGIPLEE
jgi:uncharacterized protein